ncbi:hypothetical protein [Nocardia sp. CNY236]|uniref:hypothetical protein n=1 Tax=Nocardia sp. CNY236 TaxID=1169152 RepID=UPI0003F5C226|nr:hypothetical protein [Nocardia sp. CNY236]
MNPVDGSGVDPIVAVILACEAGFWIIAAVGLLLRYGPRLQKVSTAVLAMVPLIDVILLVAVAIDVHQGAEVTGVHRLAGIYLGVTIVFGKPAIQWLDARFAHWFAGAPRPPKRSRDSAEVLRAEMKSFGRWLIAGGIALIVCLGLSITVAAPEQAAALREVVQPLALITVVWFLTGPAWVMGGKKTRQ